MDVYEKILTWWRSHRIRRPGDLDKLFQEFNPTFAYHSSLLEERQLSQSIVTEFFRTGAVSQFSGDPMELVQLYSHKRCYEYLRERVLARDDLDTSLVLEIHRVLNSGIYTDAYYLSQGERPGELKKQDFVTAVNAVGASARDVGQELDGLMEEVSGYCGSDLLQAAAYFHCRFENIHPFAAGNGATGRVLVNYFLLTRDHPPLVIFSEDREEYLQCLTAYDQEKNCQPLSAFFEKELLKTWSAEI